MKTLVILKGLAKTEKLKWIEKEGFSNFLLDIDTFRKLYSTPELTKPGIETLGRSFGNLVHQRFIEALIIRLGKGCLVVVDLDDEPTGGIETLALIHGYKVFYHVQPIPQDYYNNPGKYNLGWQENKRRDGVEKEIKNFLSQNLNDKTIIDNAKDLMMKWEENEVILEVKPGDTITHISDIHSNWTIWKSIKRQDKYIIHHGDYIDGPEVGGSRKIIDSIISCRDSNRYWLEGNHEIRLRRYLGWIILKSTGSKTAAEQLYSLLPEDFINTTMKEFSDVTVKQAKVILEKLNDKLKTHIIIVRDEEVYICTHAGLKMIEQLDPKFIGNVIYGNRDIDKQDREFTGRYKDSGYISIHAHCKYPAGWELNKYSKVINIDPESENDVIILSNKKNNLSYGKNIYKSTSKRSGRNS